MTQDIDTKTQFEFSLKGKQYGGELHSWSLRDVTDEKGDWLGRIAYGYRNGFGQPWRTSAVVKIHEISDKRFVETKNSYYLLAGEPANDQTKRALYNTVYG